MYTARDDAALAVLNVDLGTKIAISDGGDAHDVCVSATVIGLNHCKSGALGEMEHVGKGALHRVIRDGPPPCNKLTAAAGGGDSVPEEVDPSLCPGLLAISTYRCLMPCVLCTTAECV